MVETLIARVVGVIIIGVHGLAQLDVHGGIKIVVALITEHYLVPIPIDGLIGGVIMKDV